MKTKKRLEKGIESKERQILLHEKKLEEAIKKEEGFLVDYYSREIAAKRKDLEKTREKLKKT